MTTARAVLKLIANPCLTLNRGPGYWYWAYDDGEAFETESVMVPRLSDLTTDQWVEEGRAFLKQIER